MRALIFKNGDQADEHIKPSRKARPVCYRLGGGEDFIEGKPRG